jgi:hypothetical protein
VLLKYNGECDICLKSCLFINTTALNINCYPSSVQLINDCIFKNYDNTKVSFKSNCIDIEQGNLMIRNCIFEELNFYGSVIYIKKMLKSLIMEECVFKSIHKISGNGSAMYVNLSKNSIVQITDCRFMECRVGSGGYGGAIYLNISEEAIVKLNGTLIFTSNHADVGWDIFINKVFIYLLIDLFIFIYLNSFFFTFFFF